MSDQPQHKSSLAIDDEIKKIIDAGQVLPPRLVATMQSAGGPNFEQWVNKALQEAQEDKERFLGRLPAKAVPQPNPAVSSFQHKWQSSSQINNTRELGPGDVKRN